MEQEKNKKEVPAEEASSHEETTRKSSKQDDSSKINYCFLGGGALVIMGVYFTNRETQFVPQEAQIVQQIVQQQAKPEPTYDPFYGIKIFLYI